MVAYVLTYSSHHRARHDALPPAGTVVEIETLADLDALSLRLGGAPLILRTGVKQAPSWADWHYLNTPEENDDDHIVHNLPEGWREMRWIEVYNGLRE